MANGLPAGVTFAPNPGVTIPQLQTDINNGNLVLQGAAAPGTPAQPPALPGADASTTIIPGVNDPATIAGYTQAIGDTNAALGNLPTQLQGSENNIQNNYNTAYQQLLGQLNSANQAYGQNTTANKQSYVTNKNTIGTNAGQNLTGIERLLASRGAGGSSAALFGAPQAVGTEATQQRGGAGQTYGANQNALDTSIGTYREQNQNNVNSIGTQEGNQTNAAEEAINQTRGGLLQQLATLSAQKAAASGANPTTAAAPYLASANSALSAAANLGLNVAPLNYNTTAYAAPSASTYVPNPFAAPVTANPQAGIAGQSVAPALNPLLRATNSLSGVPNLAAAPTSPTAGA